MCFMVALHLSPMSVNDFTIYHVSQMAPFPFSSRQVLSLADSICCHFFLTLEDQVPLYIAHWCRKSGPPHSVAIWSFGSNAGHLKCGHFAKLPNFARSECCQSTPPHHHHHNNTSVELRSSFLTLDFWITRPKFAWVRNVRKYNLPALPQPIGEQMLFHLSSSPSFHRV